MTTPLKAHKNSSPRQRALPLYVNIGEAADEVTVSIKNIRRRINDGAMPAFRFGRRKVRIRLEDLEAVTRRLPAVRH